MPFDVSTVAKMTADVDGAGNSATGDDADLILVGGGLANGLIAWRLRILRPSLRVLLLESGPTLGGNHTWSFHDGDLSAVQHAWIAPLVSYRWSHHSVAFPKRQRRLASGYASITSSQFNAVLMAALGRTVRTASRVVAVAPRAVTLADGTVLRARAVIDGRGVRPSPHLVLGYQKFLGQELRLTHPHGLDGPVLIDATVSQQDGYRFVYVLPFTADTLLIEDTFYADGSAMDLDRLRANIAAYASARNWVVAEQLREELGVLPITLEGDVHAYWRETGGVPQAGLAAGLFHPTTGYSLPDAVRMADRIAALPDLSAEVLFDSVRAYALDRWKAQGFFRLLNRMWFRAALPSERWRVIHRFYGLPAPLIDRFYAARLHLLDKARIVTGKPPVPFGAGVRAAFSSTMAPARRDAV